MMSAVGVSKSIQLGPGDRWYVAQTLARREAGAAQQLKAQGFRVFMPQMIKSVRHARRLKSARVALFPGYVFIALNLRRDRWRAINGTFNVSRLIMSNELPTPVPPGVVETVMTYCDLGGLCRFELALKQGEVVRVIAGPFAQVLGRIASQDDKARVRVLLEIMGGVVLTTLERQALERAK